MTDPLTRPDMNAWEAIGQVPDPASWATWYIFYGLAKQMHARTTVEIGIGRGQGTYTLGLHAKECGGTHYAIDVAGTPILRARKIRDAFQLPVVIMQADSKAIEWAKRIDLIYIDGGHSFEQATGDLENYAKWVRRHGLIVMDDYWKKHHGVTQAADAYFAAHPEFEVMHFAAPCWALARRV